MSDEEENEEDEDVDSDENSSDASSQDNSENAGDLGKSQQVESDMKLIGDIFEYIDNNTNRITVHGSMIGNNKASIPTDSTKQHTHGPVKEKRDINWSNYDLLNDVDRAKLLEKAISMLATDEQAL